MITRENSENIPDQPGVYFFKKGDTPLYIGKSVNLRTRINSHIAQAKLSDKENKIVSESDNLDYITTLTNFDAIILEAELIRKHKPQYNVLWKDDKNFLYIKITVGEEYPKIYPVRKEDDGESKYFGPFRSTNMTHQLIRELRRIVPFCTKKSIGKRRCFYAKIGYCDPCPNYVESLDNTDKKEQLQKEYSQNIRKAIRILSGQTQEFVKSLEKQLALLSKQERFEEAIEVRNRLFQFTMFLDRRSFDESKTGNIDIDQLEREFEEFMEKHFSTTVDNDDYRIECYDISNLFGKQTTGSMVVFQDGLFDKKEYKRFKVRKKGISDIHMLEEVLQRRLAHDDWEKPDLIILDGGKPQLRHIDQMFRDKGVEIPLMSIAKRPDRVLIPKNEYKPIHVEKDSLLFRLFQALRDESHRFAKKYHVMLRKKRHGLG